MRQRPYREHREQQHRARKAAWMRIARAAARGDADALAVLLDIIEEHFDDEHQDARHLADERRYFVVFDAAKAADVVRMREEGRATVRQYMEGPLFWITPRVARGEARLALRPLLPIVYVPRVFWGARRATLPEVAEANAGRWRKMRR